MPDNENSPIRPSSQNGEDTYSSILEINRTISRKRILQAVLVTILLQVMLLIVVLFYEIIDKNDSRGFSYHAINLESIDESSNPEFLSIRYPNHEDYSLLKAYDYLGNREFTIHNPNRITQFQGEIPGNPFCFLRPVDMNNDSLEEIMFAEVYPESNNLTVSPDQDSVRLCMYQVSDETCLPVLSMVRPDTLPDSATWGWSIKSAVQYDCVTPAQTEDYAVFFSNGNTEPFVRYRYVHLIRKNSTSRETISFRTTFFPNMGTWQTIDNQDCFTFCGSNPQNDIEIPVEYTDPHGRTIIETLGDMRGSIQQITEAGQLRWIRQFDSSGGATYVYPLEDGQLLGMFVRESFHSMEHPLTTLYYLNARNGVISDSLEKTGIFYPFTGVGVNEIDRFGFFIDNHKRITYLHKNGNLTPGPKLCAIPSNRSCPVIRLSDTEYAFATQCSNETISVYGFNGRRLCSTGGILASTPVRVSSATNSLDYIIAEYEQGTCLLFLQSTGFPFWWLWPYRWLVVVLFLPPVIALSTYVFYRIRIAEKQQKSTLKKIVKQLQLDYIQIRNKLSERENELEKKVEELEELSEKNERQNEAMQAIVNGIEDVLLTITQSFTIDFANQSALNQFGKPLKEVKGLPISEIAFGSTEGLIDLIQATFSSSEEIREYSLFLTLNPVGEREYRIFSTRLEGRSKKYPLVLLILRNLCDNEPLEASDDEDLLMNIIGRTEVMRKVRTEILMVADYDITVLITGENGTGKEIVAESIHNNSKRADKPFLILDCTTIQPELAESQLFGHKRGAFTGASADKKGMVELASGGTLFIDEINSLPLNVQAKLLRFLESKQYQRLGAEGKYYTSDVRIIAASNQNLTTLVEMGKFREDLYQRLKQFIIEVPALRDRKNDILLLTEYFVREFSNEYSKTINSISSDARKLIIDYRWPGNVRELKNTIGTAVIRCDTETITVFHLPDEIKGPIPDKPIEIESNKSGFVTSDENFTGDELSEKVKIEKVLKENDYAILKSVEILGMHRATLRNKIRKYNIWMPENRRGPKVKKK